MEQPNQPDTTTGKKDAPILLPASDPPAMEAPSKRVQTTSGDKNFSVGFLLGLIQSDLADLQKNGLRVGVLAKDGKVYFSIEYPGHELSVPDTGKIYFLLDGEPV